MAVTDLTVAATVAAELGVSSSDPLLSRYISVASDAIRSYLGRGALHYEAAITETHPGLGRQRILLARTPVLEVTSITLNGTEVQTDGYEIENANVGTVYRRYGWPFTGVYTPGITQDDWLADSAQRLIEVTYSGGWVTPAQEGTRTLPYDIEQAAIEIVTALYRQRGSNPNIASESLGDASVSYRDVIGVLPDTAKALLKPYRRLA